MVGIRFEVYFEGGERDGEGEDAHVGTLLLEMRDEARREDGLAALVAFLTEHSRQAEISVGDEVLYSHREIPEGILRSPEDLEVQ